jgi:hypothetical protein
MDKLKVASKILGGVAAGCVLYNAHKAGKINSNESIKNTQANRTFSLYTNSRKMQNRDFLTSNLKDYYFKKSSDWSFPEKLSAIGGYIKGAFSQMADDVVPAVLATGTLLSKRFSKFFGVALGIYALKYLIFDVIDIGRPKYLK